VTDKKLSNWSQNKKDVLKKDINLNKDNLNEIKELDKYRNELSDLLEVIQYVITNAINNQEFRTFMIKRFLRNYVPQGTSFYKCLHS